MRRFVWISIFHRKSTEGLTFPVFVIDERECSSPAEMKEIVKEALDEIMHRHIVGEFETRPVREGEPPSTLPRWPEYKRTLEGSGAE
ncbi:hypothetical protein AB0N60_04685 [Streptomyces microflavus]|jgi:hypothetical protein